MGGFDEVSPPDVLDVLVFYEKMDCFREGFDMSTYDDLPQDRIWEAYNLTDAQTEGLCEFALECRPHEDGNGKQVAHEGVYLGNFNYDIARSVQTYTAPIYGLPMDQSVTYEIVDYYDDPNRCVHGAAHHGHGTASGCSTNTTCSNTITFNHDQGHNGLLEYFQWEPVSVINPHRALLCQNITPRITHGTLHHHGTPKKITAQLKVVVQCQTSKTIHHEK